MQKAKEAASNVAASAKAGLDKTKAVVQEKVDKMTAHDPVEKDMATQRKEERITQAEINKQETREHNAAATEYNTGVAGTGAPYSHSATGTHGHSTGVHQTPAVPGYGSGQTLGGHLVEGTHQMPGHGSGQTLGGHLVEGTHQMPGHGTGTGQSLGEHLVGKSTGAGGTTAHHTQAGVNHLGTHPTGHGTGTGGTYN